jgi:hypothetical protein
MRGRGLHDGESRVGSWKRVVENYVNHLKPKLNFSLSSYSLLRSFI